MDYFVLAGLHLAHVITDRTDGGPPQRMDRHLPPDIPADLSMRSMVGTKASLAWFVLCALTMVGWASGANHGFGQGRPPSASLAIFAVAIFTGSPDQYVLDETETVSVCCAAFSGVIVWGC